MKSMVKYLVSLAICFSALSSYAQDENSKSSNNSSSSSEDSDRVPVSTGKYITGGVLGSTLGLGIGHGVQGRYGEKGWIFTATEVPALVVMLVGAAQCQKDKDDGVRTDCTSSQKSMIVGGYAAFLGFHIWEVLDVWLKARPVDEKVSAFIIPNPEAPAVGVVYRF